jgi:uridine kinase
MTFEERNIVKAYSVILDTLSVACKTALAEHLTQSLKKEHASGEDNFYKLYGSWKSDKSAEEIIAEIRDSRSFGNTRKIENWIER